MKRENPRAEDVIAYVDRHWGEACAMCDLGLLGHDAVLSLMLGFSETPTCASCVAGHLGREPLDFLKGAYQSVARLPCYRTGWEHADARLEAAGDWPVERLPANLRMKAAAGTPAPDHEQDDQDVDAALLEDPTYHEWDAGDRGCGELALELKLRMRKLQVGSRLLLLSTDLGAPADIPAWCRLTGNRLVAAEPPRFLLERPTQSPVPDPPSPTP